MWKNIVEPERPQMTIWRMHFAFWIPKATNMHSEYVILIASPLQQWLHECVSVLCYTYNACLVKKYNDRQVKSIDIKTTGYPSQVFNIDLISTKISYKLDMMYWLMYNRMNIIVSICI